MRSSGETAFEEDRLVTAIIPTYNRANYLRSAISSVLAQSFPPAQIIVVDDGSKDNTHEIVTEFASQVGYIAKENGGKSSALNFGLRHAKGKFIWIFDDDDLAEPDALRKLVSALQDNPACGFAYGDYDIFTVDDAGGMRRIPVRFPAVPCKDLYLALMERSFILQQGMLARKSCYDEVGDFNETLIRSQDLDMMLRLARRYTGVKVEGITFHLRQHGGIRGSAAAPLLPNRSVEGWVKSDRKIIGQIYANHDLRDFLPGGSPAGELTEEQSFTCLLQRSCILARKGLWNEAAQDFRKARELARTTTKARLSPDQTNILRRMFDLFSYAPHTFESAVEFTRALREMRPKQLQRDMRAAILWPLPLTIGAALLNRHYTNARRFLYVYFVLATPSTVIRSLFSRSFFSAGLQLVRFRSSVSASHDGDTKQATTPSAA